MKTGLLRLVEGHSTAKKKKKKKTISGLNLQLECRLPLQLIYECIFFFKFSI
jgi:hypothetical protein